jgi:hypothetical protein
MAKTDTRANFALEDLSRHLTIVTITPVVAIEPFALFSQEQAIPTKFLTH